MKRRLINFFQRFLIGPSLVPFYTHLYKLSLRGMGILNSEGSRATGERWLMRFIKNYFPIKSVCDVGANDGGYTAEMLAFFPKARFHCFEPNPETYKLLSANLQAPNISLYHLGLSDSVRQVKLYDFSDTAPLKPTQPTATFASLYSRVITDLHHQPLKTYSVKTTTLDVWAKASQVKTIDWLKIDTEGHELAILKGAQSLLCHHQIHLVQFEFNDMHAYSHTFILDILALLPQYKIFRLLPSGWWPLTTYRPLTTEIFGFQNLVALCPRWHQLLPPSVRLK